MAEAFTASDAGGVLTKITEIGVGSCVIGGGMLAPHPEIPAIIPRTMMKRRTLSLNMVLPRAAADFNADPIAQAALQNARMDFLRSESPWRCKCGGLHQQSADE